MTSSRPPFLCRIQSNSMWYESLCGKHGAHSHRRVSQAREISFCVCLGSKPLSFCLCLSLPMVDATCRQLNPASRRSALSCFYKAPHWTSGFSIIPTVHRVSNRKPSFFPIYPNVDHASLCKGIDDPCRRFATHRLRHLDHPQILPLHAGPAVRTLPERRVLTPDSRFRSHILHIGTNSQNSPRTRILRAASWTPSSPSRVT